MLGGFVEVLERPWGGPKEGSGRFWIGPGVRTTSGATVGPLLVRVGRPLPRALGKQRLFETSSAFLSARKFRHFNTRLSIARGIDIVARCIVFALKRLYIFDDVYFMKVGCRDFLISESKNVYLGLIKY